MTAITFPNSPSSGDTHTAGNGIVYTYDGEKWTSIGTNSAGTWTRSGTEVSLTNAGDDLNVDSGTLFVDASTNNVGIGTTTPENYGGGFVTVHARGTSSTAGGIFQTQSFDGNIKSYFYCDSSTDTGRIGTVTNHPFIFVTNTTERMRIDSNGNVGIGTISPNTYAVSANQLVVSNTSSACGITIASSTTNTGNIFFADGTTGAAAAEGYIQYNHPGNYLIFGTANTERMHIDSSGLVGIGRTPDASYSSYKLQIRGTDTNGSFIHISTPADGNSVANDGMVLGKDNSNGYLYVRENVPLLFGTNDIERMRLLSGGGLTFNGDTAQVNALDDYEEGTWSPTVVGNTTSGTVSYSTRVGVYTKIGNIVSIQFYVVYTSGNGAGNLEISGLPYVPAAGSHYGGVNIGYLSNLSLSANHFPTCFVGNGTNTLHFYQYPVGGGNAAPIPYDGASNILASAVYKVA